MSTPAAKRRRVEAANAALRKPFTSPVIRRSGAESPTKAGTPQSTLCKSVDGDPVVEGQGDGNVTEPGTSEASRFYTQASPQRTHKASRPLSSKPSSSSLNENPLVSLVASHQKDLDSKLKELNKELETYDQAARIEKQSESKRPGDPVDQELRDLIAKWKSASKLAAEELFDLVKARVAGAGGSDAWNKMRQTQRNFYAGNGEEFSAKPALAGDEDAGDERDRSDFEDDVDGSGFTGNQATNDPASAEGDFNMLSMLESLNIDPKLLGYNAADETWSA